MLDTNRDTNPTKPGSKRRAVRDRSLNRGRGSQVLLLRKKKGGGGTEKVHYNSFYCFV